MEIIITANAHYQNGYNEHFSRVTEVSDEEYILIKQCAEANDGKLDTLETTSPALHEKLYTQFYSRAIELESSVCSYKHIRTFIGQSTLNHRVQTHQSSISITLGE